MREILTLQLGHLGNYTATHFWNAQESYFTYSEGETSQVDHDVHWRTGQGADGSETFLPRTVIYDLKGGFGSLRKINALYDATDDGDASASSLWSGKPTVHKSTPLQPSEYQTSLETGSEAPRLTTTNVRYWSDFSRVYFHPRSLVQLYDYELHSSVMPFERYSMGKELFSSLDKEHDIIDRDWRPFVEECDRMEGIQVFTSLDDAWGGFSAAYVEALRDEYGKQPIWIWGLQGPLGGVARDKRQLRLTNVGQGVTELSSYGTTVMPLSAPETKLKGVQVDVKSNWHYSALLATAIETVTLPSRLRQTTDLRPLSLDEMAMSLNTTGRQHLAAMTLNIDGEKIELFSFDKERRDVSQDARSFGHVKVMRDTKPEPKKDEEEDEELGEKRNRIGDPVYTSSRSTLEFPLLDSFPSIYTEYEDRSTMPTETSLYTDKSVSKMTKMLKTQLAWASDVDDREDMLNSIAEISEAYQDDWDSGSDDGDDDL